MRRPRARYRDRSRARSGGGDHELDEREQAALRVTSTRLRSLLFALKPTRQLTRRTDGTSGERAANCRSRKKFGAARVSTHNNSGRKSFASRSTSMVRMAATQGATFAPFSDSRPYELKSRFELPKLPMVPRTMPSPPRTPSPTRGSQQLSSRESPRSRFNLKSPPTSKVDYEAAASARIIQSMQASMDMGCEMAVAFAKAVSAASSPRIAVLSPRKPLPAQLPRELLRMPSSPRSSGRKPEKKESDASEGERRWHVELGSPRLFADDQRWLFYPPTMRERPEHIDSHSNSTRVNSSS